MALTKIRLANKKARREQKRKQVRNEIAADRQRKKVQQKRTREMFLAGRREYQAKRKSDRAYIDALEAELSDG